MSDNKHAEFNKFQTMFYTSIDGLNSYTNYEFKKHSFTLLYNLGKGFPLLSVMITNVYSDFVKFDECPSLIKALQRKFVNGFSSAKMPKHIYYRNSTTKAKVEKIPKKRKPKNVTDFDDDIKFQIKSILFFDEKTYEYLKYSKTVQELGNELINEFNKKEIEIYKKSSKK